MRSDLHLHSSQSDGLRTPAEVVQTAHGLGLELIALCDHDTTTGVNEAATEAATLGLRFVPSVEMTASEGTREEHFLGHFVDHSDPALIAHNEETCRALRERLAESIEILRPLGFETTIEEVAEISGNPPFLDRPHLARLMKERGFVEHFGDAFRLHLADDAPAHVPLKSSSVETTIARILDSGGLPFLAHPKFFNWPTGLTSETLPPLIEMGLVGIEVYHPAHTAGETALYLTLAKEHDLIITGGSDCHSKPDKDGRLEIENRVVPDNLGEHFLERCAKRLGRALI